MRVRFLSAVVICASVLVSAANDTDGAGRKVRQYPSIVIPWVTAAPTVDGKLTDLAWREAAKVGPFVTVAGETAKNKTFAYLLRSKDTLFIGVSCGFQKGAKLTVEETKRDTSVWTDDCVEVFIDPTLSFRKYYHLIVNAGNVQYDEQCDKMRLPMRDRSWNPEWKSAVAKSDDAWTVEMAIPLAAVGIKQGTKLVGLNVCRNDRTCGEATCWSPTLSGFHEPTLFAAVGFSRKPGGADIQLLAPPPAQLKSGPADQRIIVENEGDKNLSLTAIVVAGNAEGRMEKTVDLGIVKAQSTKKVVVPYEFKHGGQNALITALFDARGDTLAVRKVVVPLRENFVRECGYLLPVGKDLGLWWAEGLYKIHREDPKPTRTSKAMRVSLAGREYEPVQLVLRPRKDTQVFLRVSNLVGPSGARIPAKNVSIFEVAYVPVKIPSDKFGWADDWPDPLPPLEKPILCKAGENQPFWILVHAPADARAGTYRGKVRVDANDKTIDVPLEVHVFGFALTEETHTRTAYGVSPDFGFQGVTDPADQEKVYDLFMQSFRDHRISPYSPFRFYPMDIKLHAPRRRLSYGPFAVEFELDQPSPWKIFWNGKEVAWQRTSMTHFEKKGIGWEGTGLGWPNVESILSVKELERTATMRVLEVVAAHISSGAAARSFRLIFHIFVPSGDDWIGMRLVRMEGTDPTEVTVQEYYNIPYTAFKADRVAKGKNFVAWSGGGLGFGMVCLDGNYRNLTIGKGGDHATVANPVANFKIKTGQKHEGWGPLVVYFVSEKTDAKSLARRAEDLAKRIDPAHPTSYKPRRVVKVVEKRENDYKVTHDFTRFDEGAKRYIEQFHFNGFRMSCMPGQIAGHKRFTKEYKHFHKLMYGPVIRHLKEKGWLKYAYSYWFDEPSEKDYPYVIKGMKLLGEDCQGLTRLLTEQPEPPLYGHVDLWVPVLSMYNPLRCHERQAAGDEVWWYVCCGPRAPYPNNFIDHPAINHRIRFWMAEKYGVTGSLFWSTTFYGHKPDGTFRNPWEDGMTYRPSGGYWGNGDGMLLYPPCRKRSDRPIIKGPVASIRWETLRDGLEDREYFWTLRQEVKRLEAGKEKATDVERKKIEAALALAKKALDAPNRLASSLTQYTKNPQDLLRERNLVAEAIEACKAIRF